MAPLNAEAKGFEKRGLVEVIVSQYVLHAIVLIAFSLLAWGVRKDLPFIPEMDEGAFVAPAVRIAASANLNPGWFGHPGSTTIYPLAFTYHLWYAIAYGGILVQPVPQLLTVFTSNQGQFYIFGRLLSIIYAVISIPIVYAIGRRTFGERVGLIGAWLCTLYPIVVLHAQVVRTDSAATFWGLLSLWLCLRLYDRQTIKNTLLVGLAIGLATATRYFMAIQIILLIAVFILVWWRDRSQPGQTKSAFLGISIGSLAASLAFAVSTPYFFLDFPSTVRSLQAEAETTHLGADGLSPIGNFIWYLLEAIPRNITWPETIMACIGICLILRKRRALQMLLLGFVAVFLMGISIHPLHWARWVIEILPLVALFVAYAADSVIGSLSMRLRLTPSIEGVLVMASVLLISAWPTYDIVLHDIRDANPSTRILAREWVLQNIPAGSKVAQEWYAAPLGGTDFVVFEQGSLATNHTLDDYYRDGYRYLVASSYMYGRYFNEPGRYSKEVAFYQTLFSKAHLLRIFNPSSTQGGPVIQIYELRQGEVDSPN